MITLLAICFADRVIGMNELHISQKTFNTFHSITPAVIRQLWRFWPACSATAPLLPDANYMQPVIKKKLIFFSLPML